MALSPESHVHHVDPLNEWVAIETSREQMVQLRQGLQILRMVVTGFHPIAGSPSGELAASHAADLHHWNAGAQELRQSKLLRLKYRV